MTVSATNFVKNHENEATYPFSTRVSLSTASHIVQPRSRQISSLVVFHRRYTDSIDCQREVPGIKDDAKERGGSRISHAVLEAAHGNSTYLGPQEIVRAVARVVPLLLRVLLERCELRNTGRFRARCLGLG